MEQLITLLSIGVAVAFMGVLIATWIGYGALLTYVVVSRVGFKNLVAVPLLGYFIYAITTGYLI
jgi:hypothetical protein